MIPNIEIFNMPTVRCCSFQNCSCNRNNNKTFSISGASQNLFQLSGTESETKNDGSCHKGLTRAI